MAVKTERERERRHLVFIVLIAQSKLFTC